MSGKRVLTKDEEYGIAVYYAIGAPIKFISKKFFISRTSIHRTLVRLGVDTDRGKKS